MSKPTRGEKRAAAREAREAARFERVAAHYGVDAKALRAAYEGGDIGLATVAWYIGEYVKRAPKPVDTVHESLDVLVDSGAPKIILERMNADRWHATIVGDDGDMEFGPITTAFSIQGAVNELAAMLGDDDAEPERT